MDEYIQKIRRVDQNDVLGEDNFNVLFKQLQHNIDLLFSQWKSSHVAWNVSELLFGNILDFDSTGNKRFINGGKLDSIEKVFSFKPNTGSVRLEENNIHNNEKWLTWDIPQYLTDNLILSRNIVIPNAIRHQNIIVGFKMVVYGNGSVIENERFDIFINGVQSGTFNSGTSTIDNIVEAKTGYGTYNLRGTESNINIELVRSPTNSSTPQNYSIKISNIFCGLHTLGNSSYSMNYPSNGSLFVGKNADINAFYDFGNNSVRPIPSFLLNNGHLEGESSLSVTVNPIENTIQDTYYVGINATGNGTGINSSNRISATNFFNINSFSSKSITVDLEYSESYDILSFSEGVYNITVHGDSKMTGIVYEKGAYVTMTTDGSTSLLELGTVTGRDHSKLKIVNHASDDTMSVISDHINLDDYTELDIYCGVFGMPLNSSGLTTVTNNSSFTLNILDSFATNIFGLNSYGISFCPILVRNFSNLIVINENTNNLNMLITRNSAPVSYSIKVDNHSNIEFEGVFALIDTTADVKHLLIDRHSSIVSSGVIGLNFSTITLSSLSFGNFSVTNVFSVQELNNSVWFLEPNS